MATATPPTDWSEVRTGDEDARFTRYGEELAALAKKRAGSGPVGRALHAKGQLGLRGDFTVLPDIPEHARVGPFASPTTYPAYVRYSNGSGSVQPDGKPDVRGVAVKLVGVPGKKIIAGLEDAKTQDFLAIRSPSTPFRDADEFVSLVRATATPALALPRLLWAFGPIRTFGLIKQLTASLKQPMTSLATTAYFSALPIKLGPHAIHYALAPQARAVSPNGDGGRKPPDYLADELAQRLREGAVEYDFRVQFYVDPVRTPIEDASVEWRESDAPFVTLARLTLPKQDVASPEGRRVAEYVETLSFDPWHATEDLRPLGNMMRARNHAYRISTQARGAAPEPDGTETFG